MSAPLDEYEKAAKKFSYAFKNGRGYPPKHPTFADVVRFIVRELGGCPAFASPSVLVPIPRSGHSLESFGRDACLWPSNALAVALAGRHVMAPLLVRRRPVQRSSDSSRERVSVAEHIESLDVVVDGRHLKAPLVLLDDLLTKGTQAMAASFALRRAGYTGPIQVFCVHQTVAPRPSTEQRESFLTHRITWTEGQRLADRVEVGRWGASPRRLP